MIEILRRISTKTANGFGILYKNDSWLIISLIILSLVVRGILFLNSENAVQDAIIKIVIAQRWLEDPRFIASGIWAPMQTYLIALSLMIHYDPVLSPRLMNLLFSSITILPYFYLIRFLFDKKIAVFSCLALILYPLHAYNSVSSLAETPFLFFLFLSLYLFFKFMTGTGERRNRKLLILSAFTLTFASMTRYDGWVFIIFLGIFLLYKEKAYLPPFIAITMFFPVFWMVGNYLVSDDPLSFIKNAEELAGHPKIIEAKGAGIIYTLTGFPLALGRGLSPLVVFFGFIGIIYSFGRRYRRTELSILFTLLLLIFTLKYISGSIRPIPRYTILMGMLLIPYAYTGIENLIARFGSTKYKYDNKYIYIIASILIISIPVAGIKYDMYTHYYLSPGAREVALWLDENVPIDQGIVIDRRVSDGLLIALYSGRWDRGVNENVYVLPGGLWINTPNEREISRLLRNANYLVYSPDGNMQFLNLSRPVEYRYHHTFREEYRSGLWRVYSIS